MGVLIVAGGHAPPMGTRRCHPAPRGHAKAATRFMTYAYDGTGIQKRSEAEPWVAVIGGRSRGD